MELTKEGKEKLDAARKSGRFSGTPSLDYSVLEAISNGLDSLEDIIHRCKTSRTYKGNKIKCTDSEIQRRVLALQKSGFVTQ